MILSQNIRSYSQNSSSFLNYLERIPSTQIILFQEVWKFSGNESIDGFQQFEFVTRKKKAGGGVAICVSNNIQYKRVNTTFVESVFESVAIQFKYSNSTYTIVNVYVPPKVPISTTLDHIATLKTQISKKSRLILMGDFNIDVGNLKNHEFEDQMVAWNLPPLFKVPTRITPSSATSLDLTFCNDPKISAGVVDSSITDHLLIYAGIEGKKINSQVREFPDHSDNAISYLKQYLGCVDFQEVLSNTDEKAFTAFDDIMKEAKHICCTTIRSYKKQKIQQPWFTKGLKQSSMTKDHLFRLARKKKDNK